MLEIMLFCCQEIGTPCAGVSLFVKLSFFFFFNRSCGEHRERKDKVYAVF